MVFLTTTASPSLRGGERVWLHARPTALHVFDTAGNRLTKADTALLRAEEGVQVVRNA